MIRAREKAGRGKKRMWRSCNPQKTAKGEERKDRRRMEGERRQ